MKRRQKPFFINAQFCILQNEKEAREGFIETGITIVDLTDEQKEEFKQITRPVWDKYTEVLPKELIQLVVDT